jgi:hypothetical protein
MIYFWHTLNVIKFVVPENANNAEKRYDIRNDIIYLVYQIHKGFAGSKAFVVYLLLKIDE